MTDTILTPGVREWLSQGQHMRYQGQTVFVRVEGSGPALLLIHGYPTASYDWHGVWPELAKNFTLITVDMLGLGLSDKPSDLTYSISAHADLHEWIIHALGLGRVHVMAHDLGVSVAQEMLVRRMAGQKLPPIDSVVLLNGGIFPEVYRPRLILRLLTSPLGGLMGPHMSRSAFERTIRNLFGLNTQPDQSLLDDFWCLVTHRQGLRIAHKTGRFWRERMALRDRLVSPLLTRAFPVLFINGTSDPNSGQHMVDRYRQLAPDAPIVCMEGIGHWPQLEQPDQVIAYATNFLLSREW